MIVPNKVIRFNESIIGKVIYILEELSNGDLSIENLYTNTQEYFEGIDEFIFSLTFYTYLIQFK